jgi:hypothetical protein
LRLGNSRESWATENAISVTKDLREAKDEVGVCTLETGGSVEAMTQGDVLFTDFQFKPTIHKPLVISN